MISFTHPLLLHLYDQLLPQPSSSVPCISSLILNSPHEYITTSVQSFEVKYHDLIASIIDSDSVFVSISDLKEALLLCGFNRSYVRSFVIDLSELLLIIYFSHPSVLSALPLLPEAFPLPCYQLPD